MLKVKEGFVLREVSGSYCIVVLGKASKKFNGIISLNEVGAFIFKNIESGIDVEDIIKKMLEEYDIPGNNDEEKYEKASNDVNKFINEMKKAGIIEDGK